MISKNPLTDAELVVLSLIAEQPRHGYQIEQQIQERNMRAWTDLSTSSIYYLLNKLEEKGWIEPAESTASAGQGPPRKVHRISPKGEQIWKEATLQALAQPRITHTTFLLGLHNLWKIPPAEARQAVASYRDWLEKDLLRQRRELENLEELGLNRFPVDVLFEYGFVLGDAELSFLEKLISRLEGQAEETQTDKNNQERNQ